MRQTNEEQREDGVERNNRQQISQAGQGRQEWFKTIILNLIVAASVCLARAAMDNLFNNYGGNYRNDKSDYVREGYPF